MIGWITGVCSRWSTATIPPGIPTSSPGTRTGWMPDCGSWRERRPKATRATLNSADPPPASGGGEYVPTPEQTAQWPRHIVAAAAAVFDDAGRVLLVRSGWRGWEFPGGQV